MQKKVEFLICGTQKGGTTALHQYLLQHPNLFLPNKKELHFFDDECLAWKKSGKLSGFRPYRKYHDEFKEGKQQVLWGEATPIYMYWNSAPKRIAQYNRNMKIIISLRNPISRAYAHWNMELNRGQESMQFLDAIHKEESERIKFPNIQHRVFSYIDRGKYANQIRKLSELFSSENLLVLKHDDLLNSPQSLLARVWDFLGVEHIDLKENIVAHQGKYNTLMSEEALRYLKKIFYLEIKSLESMVNWDCSDWLEG